MDNTAKYGQKYPVTVLKIHDWKHNFDDFSQRENPDTEAMFGDFCLKLSEKEPYKQDETLLYRFCIRYISGLLEEKSRVKNVPEKLLSLMELYGNILPSLEIRIPEWICDYLFIKAGKDNDFKEINEFFKGKRVRSILSADFRVFDFIKSIVSDKISENSKNEVLDVLCELCDYNFSASALFEANKALYEEVLFWVFPEAICSFLKENGTDFIFSEKRRIVRSAYPGLLCSCGTLKIIETEYIPASENKLLREFVTSVVKYCDNLVRQGLGIKSKLTGIVLSAETKKLISDIVRKEKPGFLGTPARQGRKRANEKLKKEKNKESTEKETYEPFVLDVDFAKAKELEKESWNLMELIENDYGGEEIEYSPTGAGAGNEQPDKDETKGIKQNLSSASELSQNDDFVLFVDSLPQNEREILRCIMKGSDADAAAKSYGGMAEGFAERINERALEFIGDIIIDKDERNRLYVFEEYKDEFENLL